MVVVVVALNGGAAQYSALSILPFLVKQLVRLTTARTKGDEEDALQSSIHLSHPTKKRV
jgi:hypothetical protein